MNFSEALELMKQGKEVRCLGWNGCGMTVQAQYPDENSMMTEPYLYMRIGVLTRLPWTPSQKDLFSVEWEIAD